MTERGIIFGAPTIRAIIAGRKSQTRRVVSRTNCIIDGDKRATAEHWNQIGIRTAWTDPGPSPAGNAGPYLKAECDCWGVEEGIVHRLYPQWHVGQRLWVREAYGIWHREDATPGGQPYDSEIKYRADDPGYEPSKEDRDAMIVDPWRWRSPIYMPRQASRLTLEIVRVGVERLNEISEEDARAEGVECGDGSWAKDDSGCAYVRDVSGWYAGHLRHNAPSHAFRSLWDTINGQKSGCSWENGPLVWVLEFKVTGGNDG